MRNNGKGYPRPANGKFANVRAVAADAEDVLRAIENNGEVTLPGVSSDIGVDRRRYRFVFFAFVAAYVLRRRFARLRRHR